MSKDQEEEGQTIQQTYQRRLERLARFKELQAPQELVDKELTLIRRDWDQLSEEERQEIRVHLQDLGFEL